MFTVTCQEKQGRRSEIYLFLFNLFIVFLKKMLILAVMLLHQHRSIVYIKKRTKKKKKKKKAEITDCLFELSSICTFDTRSDFTSFVVFNVFVGRGFGREDLTVGLRDLIVSVPDHCLSFYFTVKTHIVFA